PGAVYPLPPQRPASRHHGRRPLAVPRRPQPGAQGDSQRTPATGPRGRLRPGAARRARPRRVRRAEGRYRTYPALPRSPRSRYPRDGLPQAGRGTVLSRDRRAHGRAALDGRPACPGGAGPTGEVVSRAMTVPHEDADKLTAKLLAGELSPEETAALRAEIDPDPDARDALARLEGVVQALRNWRQTFDALPPPVVPQLPRRRWLRYWAATAALLLAGLVAWAVLLRSRPSSTPPTD